MACKHPKDRIVILTPTSANGLTAAQCHNCDDYAIWPKDSTCVARDCNWPLCLEQGCAGPKGGPHFGPVWVSAATSAAPAKPSWQVHRQDVFEGDQPPGEGWEPFAAAATVEHEGIRESLGGGLGIVGEIIWWRKLGG